ncbi:hypothetical protein Cni_G06459 [Canna indica]|uniref:Uncharacterized protein n=1 Tax=Canna indica TaxID=4628 RepID=A0AAQ3K0A7_9LILI|nr:hypothetical protein Cni_G06459 [Canna indica]
MSSPSVVPPFSPPFSSSQKPSPPHPPDGDVVMVSASSIQDPPFDASFTVVSSVSKVPSKVVANLPEPACGPWIRVQRCNPHQRRPFSDRSKYSVRNEEEVAYFYPRDLSMGAEIDPQPEKELSPGLRYISPPFLLVFLKIIPLTLPLEPL